jgi:hypothetical protein
VKEIYRTSFQGHKLNDFLYAMFTAIRLNVLTSNDHRNWLYTGFVKIGLDVEHPARHSKRCSNRLFSPWEIILETASAVKEQMLLTDCEVKG